MEKTKFVFVILVYRNSNDLSECLQSIKEKVSDYRTIVVNSYYDEISKCEIEQIANNHKSVFLNIENRGYSYGNNRGIEYAESHFDYEFLVVSNPDITIGKFDEDILSHNIKFSIIAPKIIARDGRYQNPMSVKRSRLKEYLEYRAFKKNSKMPLFLGIIIGKINRVFFRCLHCFSKKPYRIFTAHGSFVIFTKSAITSLYPVYDENVFLFAEEGILALKAKENGLYTGQFNQIIINHKEDGSMKLVDFSLNKELAKANIYYYENYVKNKK